MSGSNHEHGHPKVGHVVPLWMLAAVWLALMFFTYITVAVTNYDLGNFNLIIAMAIATVKAALVVLFFMHLFWDNKFNALVFISSLAFVTLFIIISMLDTNEYQPDVFQGKAPALEVEAP